VNLRERVAVDGGIAIAVPILLLKVVVGVALDMLMIGGGLAIIAAIISAAVGTNPGAAALRTGLWGGGITAALSALFRLIKIVQAVAEFRRDVQIQIALTKLDQEDPK